MEQWRKIKGAKDYYEISSKGRVRVLDHRKRPKGRLIKGMIMKTRSNHACVRTRFNTPLTININRVMYESFIGDVPNKKVVMMKDPQKPKSLDNLKVVSISEKSKEMHKKHPNIRYNAGRKINTVYIRLTDGKGFNRNEFKEEYGHYPKGISTIIKYGGTYKGVQWNIEKIKK